MLNGHQRSEVLLNGVLSQAEENGNEKVSSQNNHVMVSQILANASTPSFHELYALGHNGSASVQRMHKCCAYIASNSKYCSRLNSIQAFSDINRDVSLCSWSSFMVFSFYLLLEHFWVEICIQFSNQVIGEANHLSGYSFSAHNNVIHPSAQLGLKTTVSTVLCKHNLASKAT